MRRIPTSLTVACLSAAVALSSGCARSDCVSQRQVATAKGVVAECVTEEDTRVIAAVQKVLADALGEAAATIQVSASDGVVTLMGEVADEQQNNRAEKLAYGVDGVDRVENKVRVVRPPVNPRAM